MKNLFDALILGIVEGLTEFLPISSTGHLILAGDLLDFEGDKENAFLIMIQTGAMLAVMWQYRVKFTDLTIGLFTRRDAQIFVAKLFVAFLPAAIVGLLFGGLINPGRDRADRRRVRDPRGRAHLQELAGRERRRHDLPRRAADRPCAMLLA